MQRILRHTIHSALLAGSIVGCDADDLDPATATEWEAFREAHTVQIGEVDALVIEGDVQVDREALFDYFKSTREGAGEHDFRGTAHAPGGVIDRWPAGQERNLRYCVSDEFGISKASTVYEMHRAARQWEDAAHVDFVYVPAQDANCVAGNPQITFALRPWQGTGGLAFFPSAPASNRTVYWNPIGELNLGFRIIYAGYFLRHELGHVLGLRHESTRPDSGGVGLPGCDDLLGTFATLSNYDPYSIMQHPWCASSSTFGTEGISIYDVQGARALYGPPKLVTHAPVDRNADGVMEIGRIIDCNGDRFSDFMAVSTSGSMICARSQSDGSYVSTSQVSAVSLDGFNVWGDLDGNGTTDQASFLSDVLGVARTSDTLGPTGYPIGAFSEWTFTPGALRVVGRFNADTRDDVALVGVGWWPTGPVMLGGTLVPSTAATVVNASVGGFGAWSAQPGVRVVPGDFDADGFTDIALVGGIGWSSVPIAFASGDGTWTVRNEWIGDFATWAAEPTAVVHGGDFDGDGDSDLALTGPSWWSTIPVARSNGRVGTFAITNHGVPNFPAWASTHRVTALAADFDGNGCTDLALTGPPGWSTVPLALSQCNGQFAVHNNLAPVFALRASVGPRPTVGYFDRDRKADLALVGDHSRTTITFALSRSTSFADAEFAVPVFTTEARHSWPLLAH